MTSRALKTPAAEQHLQVQKQECDLAKVAQTWEDGTEDRRGPGEEDLRGYARIRTLVLNGANQTAAPWVCWWQLMPCGERVAFRDCSGK